MDLLIKDAIREILYKKGNMKAKFILFFVLTVSAVYGQNVRTIQIDATKTDELNLSDIAEEVVVIPLENAFDVFDAVFLTDKYLFVASFKLIFQYDLSGKLMQIIKKERIINAMTGDVSSEELIVASGNKIDFYDFSGKLKKTIETKYPVYSCFLHDNKLWMQSSHVLSEHDSSYVYNISYWDASANEEVFTSFEFISPPFLENVNVTTPFYFSEFKDKVCFSFSIADAVYMIDGANIRPVVKWNINPPAQTIYERGLLNVNGIMGKYLVVNYSRTLTKEERDAQNTSYLYLEDMNTKKSFNIKHKSGVTSLLEGVKDDIYHTGYCMVKRPIEDGFFYFIKGRSDIKGKVIDNKLLKNGHVIFIVKTKQ